MKDEIRTGIHIPKAIAQAMTPIPFSFSINGEIQGVPITSPRNAHVRNGPWLSGLRSGLVKNDRWLRKRSLAVGSQIRSPGRRTGTTGVVESFSLPEVNVILRRVALREEEAELEVTVTSASMIYPHGDGCLPRGVQLGYATPTNTARKS